MLHYITFFQKESHRQTLAGSCKISLPRAYRIVYVQE